MVRFAYVSDVTTYLPVSPQMRLQQTSGLIHIQEVAFFHTHTFLYTGRSLGNLHTAVTDHVDHNSIGIYFQLASPYIRIFIVTTLVRSAFAVPNCTVVTFFT